MVPDGIFFCNFKSSLRNVQGFNIKFTLLFCQTNCNTSTTGSQFQYINIILHIIKIVQHPFHQFLGLGTGNQYLFIYKKLPAIEIRFIYNVLYRFEFFNSSKAKNNFCSSFCLVDIGDLKQKMLVTIENKNPLIDDRMQ